MSARILILVALFATSIAYAIQPDPMLNPLGLAILCLETTLLSLGLDALCRWSRWTVVIGLPLALGWIVLRLPDIAYRHDMGVEDLGRAPLYSGVHRIVRADIISFAWLLSYATRCI